MTLTVDVAAGYGEAIWIGSQQRLRNLGPGFIAFGVRRALHRRDDDGGLFFPYRAGAETDYAKLRLKNTHFER